MPAPETAHLNQDAVLWAANGVDNYGEKTVGSPVEIRVRWNAKRMETVDSKGSPMALDALAVVDRDVIDGSILWLGTLDDWYGTGSAGVGVGLHQVVTIETIRDVKGRATRRTVGLMRYKDRLPGG